MAKVLIVYSSPLPPEHSVSFHLIEIFKREYLKLHPQDELVYLDLNKQQELIHSAQMARENLRTYSHDVISTKLLNVIQEADKLLVTTPVINNMPAPLLASFFSKTLITNVVFSYKGATDGHPLHLLKNIDKKVLIFVTGGGHANFNGGYIATEVVKNCFEEFFGFQVLKPLVYVGTNLGEGFKKSAEDKAASKLSEIQSALEEF